MADLGADVCKVEPPGGEPTRRLLAEHPDYSVAGMGAYFLALNHNKRSVVLDLKQAADRDRFRALVEEADVVLTNFGPGVDERLGTDADTLRSYSDRVITCAISGFGQTGPDTHKVAFDMIAQAMGGGMSLGGRPEDPPLRAGLPIGDLGAGLMATIGILAALHQRHRTGTGQHIDLAMRDVQLSLSSYLGTMALMGDPPPRQGNAHPLHVPYDTYETADGWMVIGLVFDRAWPGFCAALDLPELDTPELATNVGRRQRRELVDSVVRPRLRTAGRDHWVARLEAARVPCAPVLDLAEALQTDGAHAREMVVELTDGKGNTARVPGNPIKMTGHQDQWRWPPALNESGEDS